MLVDEDKQHTEIKILLKRGWSVIFRLLSCKFALLIQHR
jgi:hypothetical protein